MNNLMTCDEAQDRSLQRVDGMLGAQEVESLDAHIADCAACAHFEFQQLELDSRLCAALPPAQLGADFRAAVQRRIDAAEPKQPWLDVLPDYAHLAGCAVATTVTVALFPAYASIVISVGAVATAFTYLAQTMLASALDEMDERRSAV